MSHDYLLLSLFLAIAIAFPLIPLALAWVWARLFSPAKPGEDKQSAYECGLKSSGPAQVQFRSQYYLYGLIFLVFDVETVFLLPFAVVFLKISPGAFVAMMIVILLLMESLVWAWFKGLLEFPSFRIDATRLTGWKPVSPSLGSRQESLLLMPALHKQVSATI